MVAIHFRHDWGPTCMKMDEVLYIIAETKWKIEIVLILYESCLDNPAVLKQMVLVSLWSVASFLILWSLIGLSATNMNICWTRPYDLMNIQH